VGPLRSGRLTVALCALALALAACGSGADTATTGAPGTTPPVTATTAAPPGPTSPATSGLTAPVPLTPSRPADCPTVATRAATTIAGEGLRARVPLGWDATIALVGKAAVDGRTWPYLYAGNYGLRKTDGGSRAEDEWPCMTKENVLVVLRDMGADLGRTALYASGPVWQVKPEFFAAGAGPGLPMDRGAAQHFFNAQGRGFSLYIVIGSYENRQALTPLVNEFLSGITILPAA